MNENFLEGGRNGKHAMELTLILLTLLMRRDLVILISRQCSVSRVYTAAISLIWVFWGYFVQDKFYSSFLRYYCLHALISVELSSHAQSARKN